VTKFSIRIPLLLLENIYTKLPLIYFFKIEEGLYVICTSTRYYLYLQAKRLMNVKVFTPPQLKKKKKDLDFMLL
jgi:hypothetical protein